MAATSVTLFSLSLFLSFFLSLLFFPRLPPSWKPKTPPTKRPGQTDVETSAEFSPENHCVSIGRSTHTHTHTHTHTPSLPTHRFLHNRCLPRGCRLTESNRVECGLIYASKCSEKERERDKYCLKKNERKGICKRRKS